MSKTIACLAGLFALLVPRVGATSLTLFPDAFALTSGLETAAVDPSALELFQQGEYRQAEERIRQAVKQSPDHVPARHLLVAILVARSQWEQAIQESEALLRLEPNYTPAHRILGRLNYQIQQYDRAYQHYSAAQYQDKEDKDSQFMMYLCLVLNGKKEEADFMRNATPVSRTDANFYLMNAAHAFKTGEEDRALYMIGAARHLYPPEILAGPLQRFQELGWMPALPSGP